MSTPHPPSDALLGQLLAGRFRVVAQLGAGGVAKVYRAIQEPLGREVAIKVVRSDLDPAHRKEFEGRFLKEAALAGRLSHRHVVTVFDFGRTQDGLCFIVMELLRGRTLRSLMTGDPLEPDFVARVGAGIARGLRHAHNHGLVHRDVKPSNIFLVQDDEGLWQPKLLDFGLVKSDDEASVTGLETFLGTPHYIAPEQAQATVKVDHRADIYSLGVVLYRMACGALPFTAEHPMGLALAHVSKPAPPMRERNPEAKVDPELEAIVMRCLAKSPDTRWQDAGELAYALESWRDGPEALALDPEPSLAAQPGRRLTLVAVSLGGLALLCVSALGVAGYAFQDRQPAAEPALLLAPSGVEAPAVEPPPAEDPPAQKPSVAPAVVEAPEPEVAEEAAPRFALDLPPDEEQPPPVVPSPPPDRAAVEPSVAPAPPPVVAPAPVLEAPAQGTLFYDGVAMTPAEASAVLAWVNGATEEELRAAGIYSRGVNVLLQNRPFASMEALVGTPYVGEKSVRAALGASGGGG